MDYSLLSGSPPIFYIYIHIIFCSWQINSAAATTTNTNVHITVLPSQKLRGTLQSLNRKPLHSSMQTSTDGRQMSLKRELMTLKVGFY